MAKHSAKRESKHIEWLSLIEVSGPFLTLSMLDEVFPQGLDKVETKHRRRLRDAYDEWCEAVDQADPQLKEIHEAWVRYVLQDFLGYDDLVLILNAGQKPLFEGRPANGGGRYSPRWFVEDQADSVKNQKQKPTVKMFVDVLPPKTNLHEAKKGDFWPVSPVEKMIVVCREHGVRIGLITNGEQWMLVNAPLGSISSDASWYARLWFQEELTLKAFSSLLDVRRCFGPPNENLPALLEESLNRHEEITNTLGEQVKNAVEVLVQRLDMADVERGRKLLPKNPTELYEACLTVMMRLVFILCAEQRGLWLLDDPLYDQSYAASTLRDKLQEAADQHGEEILEHRLDAWPRLLSLFRMVYGGFETDTLRLPALGGALFDPDRFPFLEGRETGTSWRTEPCRPIPIDNRTVLHLMTALEVLEQGSGALLLSYRALDVEQIGHVYEGLLEYTVKRLDKTTLGLGGTKSAKNPNISLAELESAALDGEDSLVALIREHTKKGEEAILKALAKSLPPLLETRLQSVCSVRKGLLERVKPFGNLLRLNAWEYPIVYDEGSFTVTLGPDRRETGTHYTPKSLTEEIVKTTLEPVVYDGFSNGTPLSKCRLKKPQEILSLKICDPAMGSGAFLVQVCRWLGARLVESWGIEEKSGLLIDIQGNAVKTLGGKEKMSVEPNERLTVAMRLVAERCLYGVDINPLAVELAKLSIWLTTMSKGRPFGYLDHNFRSGDSLLGLHHLDQLTQWTMTPTESGTNRQPTFFESAVYEAVAESHGIREELRSVAVRDIHDVETMQQLHRKAQAKTAKARKLADAMTAAVLAAKGNVNERKENLAALAGLAETYLKEDDSRLVQDIDAQTKQRLAVDLPPGKPQRVPLHWAIEFPEVFASYGGFDAIIGNPPFLGGRKMRGAFGEAYLIWLQYMWPHSSLNSDFCAFFFLRTSVLLRVKASICFLATNTIGQGDTARTALLYLTDTENFSIRYARSSFSWPGEATVVTALVAIYNGAWSGHYFLDGRNVERITAILDDGDRWGDACIFEENVIINFQGSVFAGKGFVLTKEEAELFLQLRKENSRVIFPFLGGNDLNTSPCFAASRWAIDFRDFPLERCEKEWPEVLERIRRLVKPERDKASRDAHKRYWWQHGDKRPALYERIRKNDFVFALVRHTKHLALARVSTKQVFQESLCILDLPNWTAFAAIQSTLHYAWARRGSSTLGEGLRYTPSDYFDTFPFLHLSSTTLEKLGEEYYNHRTAAMLESNLGLTEIYNRFHEPDESDERIVELRDLHRQMDEAVAAAYGWDDLDLGHDFHSVGYLSEKDRIRYTINEKARLEVLLRLSKLNRERYNEEQAANPTKKKVQKQ